MDIKSLTCRLQTRAAHLCHLIISQLATYFQAVRNI
jgi:hypothetical protein